MKTVVFAFRSMVFPNQTTHDLVY